MLKRILNYFRDVSIPRPSEPAPSTFGAEASNIQHERDRAAAWDKQISIEKGRPRGM